MAARRRGLRRLRRADRQGPAALEGIDGADSGTLDPHKWLYQPMECGCVLIRDGARLERTFAIHPDVFIDTRLIRTLGPGDHFGELAARDWGGGYGYARLATVRCAESGRLLRLTSENLQ